MIFPYTIRHSEAANLPVAEPGKSNFSKIRVIHFLDLFRWKEKVCFLITAFYVEYMCVM